ncbi:MAG: glycoside hydrolase family 127 protein [Candidatus Thorarchaeota archaeon]
MYENVYRKSNPLSFKNVKINDPFWNKYFEINNEKAILYQWEQLEKTHNQENFRILTGEKEGYRFGFFYCDSDLHKWSDAASRILVMNKNPQLTALLKEYINLMEKVQLDDGYLFTYNQFHFPARRWANLQIEHELYSLGHMIEAAVSYFETNEPEEYKKRFLDIAVKSADLLVKDFLTASPEYTPGHQEIEIALIRLYHLTKNSSYLDLASHFIYNRGKIPFFGFKLLSQAIDQNDRSKKIINEVNTKGIKRDTALGFEMGEMKHSKEAPLLALRSLFQFITGRYHQQNSRVEKMKRPYGHAVRWGYLTTAMAMLYQENGDIKLLKALERTWDNLVKKHMFVTGGIGALGNVEGFGRDYELNNEYCYCETCAAIANILLNWELALITNEAKYSDVLEWQLYNALSVGIGSEGNNYLYRNLLQSNGDLVRKPWFATPCCPSNISRIWASVGKYVYSYGNDTIWIHQYIGNQTKISLNNDLIAIKMESRLPWEGNIELKISVQKAKNFTIYFRIPSWTNNPHAKINDEIIEIKKPIETQKTAGGYSPFSSFFYPITRDWTDTTNISLIFPMDINIHQAHKRVRNNHNKIALSRGPIIFCFESIDNSTSSIPKASIDLSKELESKFNEKLFGGIYELFGVDKNNQPLKAIPYYCWANRGSSKMQVWIKKN